MAAAASAFLRPSSVIYRAINSDSAQPSNLRSAAEKEKERRRELDFALLTDLYDSPSRARNLVNGRTGEGKISSRDTR